MGYDLTWSTDQLAVGHAPMFDVDLDVLRDNGIDAIVNLCGEFCDLHELQAEAGFEVHYVPIPDECAPDPAAMEAAFGWVEINSPMMSAPRSSFTPPSSNSSAPPRASTRP